MHRRAQSPVQSAQADFVPFLPWFQPPGGGFSVIRRLFFLSLIAAVVVVAIRRPDLRLGAPRAAPPLSPAAARLAARTAGDGRGAPECRRLSPARRRGGGRFPGGRGGGVSARGTDLPAPGRPECRGRGGAEGRPLPLRRASLPARARATALEALHRRAAGATVWRPPGRLHRPR